MALVKVISGGQTGVDQAALRAAKAAGIPTGGYAPKGWLTEDGPAPWLADFGLVECAAPGYPARTRANVLEADHTLWLGTLGTPGGRLTSDLCVGNDRWMTAVKDLDNWHPEWAADWLELAVILNVAGNRESKSPGIGAKTERFLAEVFRLLGVRKVA